MLINCDLGESFGAWQMGNDAKIMPLIDQANIATGFHAGDASIMRRTIELAKSHGVTIGAHPSYPDLAGFGRRSMRIPEQELTNLLLYQMAALDGMAKSLDAELCYVKPHGALYNDMMRQPTVMQAVLNAMCQFYRPLMLMVQAIADNHANFQVVQKLIAESGVQCSYEVFADRRYHDDGSLVSRSQPGAILTPVELQQQVEAFATKQGITTQEGNKLLLAADSICVHGDSESALENARRVRAIVAGKFNASSS